MKKIISGLILTLSIGFLNHSHAIAGALVKSEEDVRPLEVVYKDGCTSSDG
ncbi:hypothetical protein [Paenibacillus apiarius]|uniref:Uncharacterized protein n=1 Tax=Paenibacillus apiarius TaxID=46240 RepID=A0ABT4DUS9_9BACL|nr:hypothetical protein [Paenibacillus apiarius]MCY9513770.1 hypothetical protein [Paenibacillus apiarius]MCY9520530.1 hypothetical protein [Paenibacillus apiarius]MCY9550663.1 hypothetical protein [Paenibacillus apiarius]MCY9559184.1 hypothetical protein [Paenibacillus apiarius]MCY9683021.1 hypothetical protein [Paenibacillus apiarius]